MNYLKASDANKFFAVAFKADVILDPMYVTENEVVRSVTAEERLVILMEDTLRQFGKKLTPEDVCRSLNIDFLSAETLLNKMVQLGILEHSMGVNR